MIINNTFSWILRYAQDDDLISPLSTPLPPSSLAQSPDVYTIPAVRSPCDISGLVVVYSIACAELRRGSGRDAFDHGKSAIRW